MTMTMTATNSGIKPPRPKPTERLGLSVDADTFARVKSGEQSEVYASFGSASIRRYCSARVAGGCRHRDCRSCFQRSIDDWTAYPYESVRVSWRYRSILFSLREIRYGYGRPAWGADPEAMYFVFKLGCPLP